jgi:hypothetical protein
MINESLVESKNPLAMVNCQECPRDQFGADQLSHDNESDHQSERNANFYLYRGI